MGGGGPRLEQPRLPRARLELGGASGDPVQEERSPGGLSGVGLQQSQPRGAALGAAERVARDCDPLGEDGLQLHGRPLPGRRSRLAQALTGPNSERGEGSVLTSSLASRYKSRYSRLGCGTRMEHLAMSAQSTKFVSTRRALVPAASCSLLIATTCAHAQSQRSVTLTLEPVRPSTSALG